MSTTYAIPPTHTGGTTLAPPSYDELPNLSMPCELPLGCSNAASWLIIYRVGGCDHERPGTLCNGHKAAVELGPSVGIDLRCPVCRKPLNVSGFKPLGLQS